MIRLVPLHSQPSSHVPTEQEAEARMRQEGYESFSWYDVPGAQYPTHQHHYDECIWVIRGEIQFEIEGVQYSLKPGDKLYLSKETPHTASVPKNTSVTYLVGQKKK
jgi:quercetin dioxygenase-like cupin family protein